ncbi:glycosyl hydrolase catalytic core-domain-containing protein [Cubamyces menziesii]|nr:glycosyl hydrolase catalytic core-domain-containing protein [Cubamyces menziesii]
MASKLLNLVALSSLAIMACTFGAAPTTALSTGHIHNHLNRQLSHAPIAKKRRDQTKRCKARPSTASSSPSSTPHAQAQAVTSTPAKQTSAATHASTTTHSSAPPASTTKASSGSSPDLGSFGQPGSKICAAWGDGNDPSLANFKTPHVVGLYDWGVDKPTNADKLGFQYWPMLWGGSQDKIDAFEAAIKPGLGTILLGFNEPNEQGQSNMDPQTAAALWKAHIEPKRSMGYKTCSPAMSSRPNGFDWMQQFMEACGNECTVDYQCVHWYDIGFDTLKTYLEKYHDLLGLPIILTEFADQNFNGGGQASMDDIWSFMGQAIKFFDETDWILGACPFGIMHDLQGVNTLNLLQKSDGTPTDLGYFVINDGQ